MPNITCEVTKCYYNKEGGCIREEITIEGESAVVSDETMCQSYADSKEEARYNSCSCTTGACNCTDVECTAENCKYNNDGECDADKIEVGTSSSSCCRETECETFEEK